MALLLFTVMVLNYEKSVIGFLENKHKDYEFYNFALPYGSPTFHLFKMKKKLKKKISL